MNLLLIDRENRQKLQITEKTRKNSFNFFILQSCTFTVHLNRGTLKKKTRFAMLKPYMFALFIEYIYIYSIKSSFQIEQLFVVVSHGLELFSFKIYFFVLYFLSK